MMTAICRSERGEGVRVEDITPKNICLGLEVNFAPALCTVDYDTKGKTRKINRASGIIVYIHRPHRYFVVKAAAGYKESFKF